MELISAIHYLVPLATATATATATSTATATVTATGAETEVADMKLRDPVIFAFITPGQIDSFFDSQWNQAYTS